MGDIIISDMREWLIDCMPHDEQAISEAPAAAIVRAVSRTFDGGVKGFELTFYSREEGKS